VKNKANTLIMNMTRKPVTVQYNIPNGPKRNVKSKAIPTLFLLPIFYKLLAHEKEKQ
jgi:hypothetical protein